MSINIPFYRSDSKVGKSPAGQRAPPPPRNGRGGAAPSRNGPAWGAEVVSSNIVGYEKINLTANSFVMGAAQFELVGSGTGTLSDLFSASDIPYDTEIRFLNESGAYEIYQYIEDAYNVDTDEEEPGWADGYAELTTDPVSPGTGFWVKAPENHQLTQAGQVPAAETITVTVAPGMFQMVSNPYPQAFNPNEVSWSNLDYDSEIRVLNASGAYDIYTYIEDAYNAATDEETPGWADGYAELVTTDIADVGQGFWIRSTANSDTTVTFTNPTSSSGN